MLVGKIAAETSLRVREGQTGICSIQLSPLLHITAKRQVRGTGMAFLKSKTKTPWCIFFSWACLQQRLRDFHLEISSLWLLRNLRTKILLPSLLLLSFLDIEVATHQVYSSEALAVQWCEKSNKQMLWNWNEVKVVGMEHCIPNLFISPSPHDQIRCSWHLATGLPGYSPLATLLRGSSGCAKGKMNSRCPTVNADFLVAQRKPKHFAETSQVLHLLSSRF